MITNPETDWLLASLDEVERTAREAQDALAAAVRFLAETRREQDAGLPMAEIADGILSQGGRETRLQASSAMDLYERAVMRLRGGVVRALIDEENVSLTELAQRMGVSRQVVARLYKVGSRPEA
jgi:DNA-directed RNA polymerase specialized sigma subunit